MTSDELMKSIDSDWLQVFFADLKSGISKARLCNEKIRDLSCLEWQSGSYDPYPGYFPGRHYVTDLSEDWIGRDPEKSLQIDLNDVCQSSGAPCFMTMEEFNYYLPVYLFYTYAQAYVVCNNKEWPFPDDTGLAPDGIMTKLSETLREHGASSIWSIRHKCLFDALVFIREAGRVASSYCVTEEDDLDYCIAHLLNSERGDVAVELEHEDGCSIQHHQQATESLDDCGKLKDAVKELQDLLDVTQENNV